MRRWIAAPLLALFAFGAHAQIAYRCGNAYSQEPCAQARAVDIGDSRTEAQRADAQRVAALDRQMAGEMARERAARDATLKSTAAKPAKAKRPRVSKIKWFRP